MTSVLLVRGSLQLPAADIVLRSGAHGASLGAWQVLGLRQAWDAPCPDAVLSLVRPTLVVSHCGEEGGTWYDGPLMQLLPGANRGDVRVLSYLPSGGPAALSLRLDDLSAGAAGGGLPLADALRTEGTAGQRAMRCLAARVAGFAEALPACVVVDADVGVPDVAVQGPAVLRAYVALALLRKAAPLAQITAQTAKPRKAWPAPWRRLCQNLNVAFHGADSGRAQAVTVTLAQIADLIPADHARPLAAELNKKSAVLPETLLR